MRKKNAYPTKELIKLPIEEQKRAACFGKDCGKDHFSMFNDENMTILLGFNSDATPAQRFNSELMLKVMMADAIFRGDGSRLRKLAEAVEYLYALSKNNAVARGLLPRAELVGLDLRGVKPIDPVALHLIAEKQNQDAGHCPLPDQKPFASAIAETWGVDLKTVQRKAKIFGVKLREGKAGAPKGTKQPAVKRKPQHRAKR